MFAFTAAVMILVGCFLIVLALGGALLWFVRILESDEPRHSRTPSSPD